MPSGADLEEAPALPVKLDFLLIHFARQVHGPVNPDQPLALQTAIPLPGQGGTAHSHSKSPLREFSARYYSAQRTVCQIQLLDPRYCHIIKGHCTATQYVRKYRSFTSFPVPGAVPCRSMAAGMGMRL